MVILMVTVIVIKYNKQITIINSNNNKYGKYYIYIVVLQNNSIKIIKNQVKYHYNVYFLINRQIK